MLTPADIEQVQRMIEDALDARSIDGVDAVAQGAPPSFGGGPEAFVFPQQPSQPPAQFVSLRQAGRILGRDRHQVKKLFLEKLGLAIITSKNRKALIPRSDLDRIIRVMAPQVNWTLARNARANKAPRPVQLRKVG